MTERPADRPSVLDELRFALAEGESEHPPAGLAPRVLAAALAARPAGVATPEPELISGAVALERAMARVEELLGSLDGRDWSAPALRDLDVQGLVGHLIGVEEAFADTLAGAPPPVDAPDHVESTAAASRAQAGRAGPETRASWSAAAGRTRALLGASADPTVPTGYYGITLPLDLLLVVRAFEMWTHEEDIRRATGRPLSPPDQAVLARMASLAVVLLPTGLARAGRGRPGAGARLVLTGPGGGTWDVSVDPTTGGAPEPGAGSARIVVDTAWFCRVVANRADGPSSGAVVDGDATLADELFAGASALALD